MLGLAAQRPPTRRERNVTHSMMSSGNLSLRRRSAGGTRPKDRGGRTSAAARRRGASDPNRQPGRTSNQSIGKVRQSGIRSASLGAPPPVGRYGLNIVGDGHGCRSCHNCPHSCFVAGSRPAIQDSAAWQRPLVATPTPAKLPLLHSPLRNTLLKYDTRVRYLIAPVATDKSARWQQADDSRSHPPMSVR